LISNGSRQSERFAGPKRAFEVANAMSSPS
jgi:hypothetical protein